MDRLKRCESCGRFAVFSPLWESTEICGSCSSWAFVGEIPPSDQIYLADYFKGKEYFDYFGHAKIHTLNFQRKFNLIRRVSKTIPKSVLDMGCAYGYFLSVCRHNGIQNVHGTEINDEAIDLCKKQGHSVYKSNDTEFFPSLEPFPDLITLWDVFEHMAHPAEILGRLAKRQMSQSLIAISTLDSSSLVAKVRGRRWRQFHPPTHIHYPTLKGLRHLMEDLGYEILHHGYFGYYRALEQYVVGLAKSEWVAIPDRIRKFPLYLNLFDSQVIVGRKI